MFVIFVFVVAHNSGAKLQRIIGTRARNNKKFAGKGEKALGEKALDTTRNGQEWTLKNNHDHEFHEWTRICVGRKNNEFYG